MEHQSQLLRNDLPKRKKGLQELDGSRNSEGHVDTV